MAIDIDMEQVGERYLDKEIRTKAIIESVYSPKDVKLDKFIEQVRSGHSDWFTKQFLKIVSTDKMKRICVTYYSNEGHYFSQKDVGCEVLVEGVLKEGHIRLAPRGRGWEAFAGFLLNTTQVEKTTAHPEPISVVENRQNIPGYNEWRETVLSRDRKCVVCGGNKSLEAHHIYGYKEYSDLRTDTENGVVVCKYCHDRYHAYYGLKDITPNKFIRYLRRFMVR